MTVYLISYELSNSDEKYKSIHSAMRIMGVYNHIMESTWLLSTPLSASQVGGKLTSYLDNNDKMFISKVSANECEFQGWLDEETWKWIREHILL
ncbi:hypothetical protein [Vibrio maritimus]|uniref:hypothetical protein n=1 Tax=Vibrio maritimus TaxID=990268 RepID=UPI001F179377|nr:hypothetical protein [Vibrio maritimus]